MTKEEAKASFPKEPTPGEHYWISREQMDALWPSLGKNYHPSCLWCGNLKRADGKPQNPCRGRVKVTLRSEEEVE